MKEFKKKKKKKKKKKAPRYVIYDNACHLHAYALNRDPVRYCNTLFFVDRFHWPNHTACSSGYSMEGRLGLERVNTEIVEQKNSMLAKLRSQLSYMSVTNFMTHTALYIAHLNQEEKRKK